jgi:hypothetical protein
MSTLRRFFNDDDERQREVDRLLESLDAASAIPQPVLFPRDARRAPLSAFIEGFSLHAATRVMASARRGLWRLCADGPAALLAPVPKVALFFLSALRHIGLLDAGDEPHLALTARTLEDIDAKDTLQQRGPPILSIRPAQRVRQPQRHHSLGRVADPEGVRQPLTSSHGYQSTTSSAPTSGPSST